MAQKTALTLDELITRSTQLVSWSPLTGIRISEQTLTQMIPFRQGLQMTRVIALSLSEHHLVEPLD
jgi:hypothetical protein